MLSETELAPDRLRPLSRQEYDRLVELGAFEDERVELLMGALVEMSPQGTPHSWAIDVLGERLVQRVVPRARVRVQLPFAASEVSEPEPDIAVVPRRSYAQEHPSEAFLIVEVTVSSSVKDRRVKAPIYARAGVPEYWVLDPIEHVLEVYTEPGPEGYERVQKLRAGDQLALQSFPDVTIRLDEVFQ